MRLSKIISLLLLASFTQLIRASDFNCQKGDPITADIGEGVIMRTCMWKNGPDVAVRVGPLELIKNGILILRTQTNSRGKLHGQFMSWSDEGEILAKGIYIEGLKEGIWIVMRKNGNSEKIHYKKGAPIAP